MSAYFDSSVLLSLLLGDKFGEKAFELWKSENERVSSILLEVECTTVMRRALGNQVSVNEKKAAEQRLRVALDEVTIKLLDQTIVEVVDSTPSLSGCRTLDVVHLSTALYFRAADPNLSICTFDARMAEIARALNFRVLDQYH
jgi:predicted nucleic acid-binding protein